MTKMKKEIKAVNKELNKRIAQNTLSLLKDAGMSVSALSEKLEQNKKLSVDRTYFSKFFNHPDTYQLPLALIVCIADYFDVTVDYLLNSSSHEDVFKDANGKHQIVKVKEIMEEEPKEEVFKWNPKSLYLRDYLQTFYCYYHSTIADENKEKTTIISGKLILSEEQGKCKAVMCVDTKKKDKDGKSIYKTYGGLAFCCVNSMTIHCVLRSDEIGECCYIIFRLSKFNDRTPTCRIGQVLSTSSGVDKRVPIVHRILLSTQEIQEKDFDVVSTHLKLNFSEIIISKESLIKLSSKNEDYKYIVQKLFDNEDQKQVYIIKEETVSVFAKKRMNNKGVIDFISDLREEDMSYRYNKVSQKSDDNIYDILRNRNYY